MFVWLVQGRGLTVLTHRALKTIIIKTKHCSDSVIFGPFPLMMSKALRTLLKQCPCLVFCLGQEALPTVCDEGPGWFPEMQIKMSLCPRQATQPSQDFGDREEEQNVLVAEMWNVLPQLGRMQGREDEGHLPTLISSGNLPWGGGDVCVFGGWELLYWKMGYCGCS